MESRKSASVPFWKDPEVEQEEKDIQREQEKHRRRERLEKRTARKGESEREETSQGEEDKEEVPALLSSRPSPEALRGQTLNVIPVMRTPARLVKDHLSPLLVEDDPKTEQEVELPLPEYHLDSGYWCGATAKPVNMGARPKEISSPRREAKIRQELMELDNRNIFSVETGAHQTRYDRYNPNLTVLRQTVDDVYRYEQAYPQEVHKMEMRRKEIIPTLNRGGKAHGHQQPLLDEELNRNMAVQERPDQRVEEQKRKIPARSPTQEKRALTVAKVASDEAVLRSKAQELLMKQADVDQHKERLRQERLQQEKKLRAYKKELRRQRKQDQESREVGEHTITLSSSDTATQSEASLSETEHQTPVTARRLEEVHVRTRRASTSSNHSVKSSSVRNLEWPPKVPTPRRVVSASEVEGRPVKHQRIAALQEDAGVRAATPPRPVLNSGLGPVREGECSRSLWKSVEKDGVCGLTLASPRRESSSAASSPSCSPRRDMTVTATQRRIQPEMLRTPNHHIGHTVTAGGDASSSNVGKESPIRYGFKQKFDDGSREEYQTFKANFFTMARLLKWSDATACIELWNALQGKAAARLRTLPWDEVEDIAAVWKALDKIYVPANAERAIHDEFMSCRKKPQDSMKVYYMTLRHLYLQAHEDASEKSLCNAVREQMFKYLDDDDFEVCKPYMHLDDPEEIANNYDSVVMQLRRSGRNTRREADRALETTRAIPTHSGASTTTSRGGSVSRDYVTGTTNGQTTQTEGVPVNAGTGGPVMTRLSPHSVNAPAFVPLQTYQTPESGMATASVDPSGYTSTASMNVAAVLQGPQYAQPPLPVTNSTVNDDSAPMRKTTPQVSPGYGNAPNNGNKGYQYQAGQSGRNYNGYGNNAGNRRYGNRNYNQPGKWNQNRDNRNPPFPKRCWNCGEEGHLKRNCPKPLITPDVPKEMVNNLKKYVREQNRRSEEKIINALKEDLKVPGLTAEGTRS